MAGIYRKMHLLDQYDGANYTDLKQVTKDVYDNITSIFEVIVAHIFAGNSIHFLWNIRASLAIFRCILIRCVEGGEINRSFIDILSDFESLLLDTALLLRDNTSDDDDFNNTYNDFLEMLEDKRLVIRVVNAYEVISTMTTSSSPSNFMISEESVLEYLNHVLKDFTYFPSLNNLREKLIFFEKFLQFSIVDYHEKMQELSICVKDVAEKVAVHSFSFQHLSRDVAKCDELDICNGILKALILQSGSSSPPPITDELLVGYVALIQYILILIQHYSKAHPLSNQLQDLHEKLGYLVQFFIDNIKHYDDEQTEQSDLRVHFQTMTRNIGSVIYSFIKNGMKRNMETEMSLVGQSEFIVGIVDALFLQLCSSPSLSNELLMGYMDCFQIMQPIMFSTIRNEKKREMATQVSLLLSDLVVHIHKDLCQVDSNLVLRSDEVLRQSLDSVCRILIWLLKDEDIDLIGLVKDKFKILYQELVFMVRLLINSRKHYTEFEKLSEMGAYFLSIVESINHLSINAEMQENFVTAGMSSGLSYLLTGILKALGLQFDSSLPFSRELLVGSSDCIQEILSGLLKDEDIDLTGPFRDQITILHEEMGLLLRLDTHFRTYIEWEKLLDDRIQIQALVRNLRYVIYSSFNNEETGKMATKMSLVLPDLIEGIKSVSVIIMKIIYPIILNRLRQRSPHTDLFGFLSYLIGNLELINCKVDLIMDWMDQFRMIHDSLIIFRSFLQNITGSSSSDDESSGLPKRIRNAAYWAEYLTASLAVGDCHVYYRPTLISDFTEEINQIREAVVDMTAKKATEINNDNISSQAFVSVTDAIKEPSDVLVPETDQNNDPIKTMDVVVGFKAEMELIRGRLTNTLKKLDVFSITGMGGLGKTTLAKKVYEDPYIVRHFQCRAWCCISQEYHKKELLFTVLGCILQLNDEIRRKSEQDLFIMLHKELMGRRYLIVMDDVWGIDAFEDLKLFFPDNGNGSRIMLTSRSKSLGLQAKYHSNPLDLRFLTDDESWELLEQKVYHKEKCPEDLFQVGKEIAQKCRGLPLAVVVISGLLSKSEKKLDLWNQVAEKLSFHVAHDSERKLIDALDLSYKFLPDYLKPLFLYLGAFPEDKQIPAETLKWLWIAEGFVQKTGLNNSLEDQAEIYLVDLTDRNLLMVAQRRYDGRVKTCRIHDLLREMSLAKAEEEFFSQRIYVSDKSLPDPIFHHHRVSISLKTKHEDTLTPSTTYEDLRMLSMAPPLHSLLNFNTNNSLVFWEETTKSVCCDFKLLRVLHFESTIKNDDLVRDALLLVRLRYISIRIFGTAIPSSISSLVNLETLIVKGLKGEILVPDVIWKMVKLRHVHINKRAQFIEDALDSSSKLVNLKTLSTPAIYYGEENKLTRRVPNVQKLRCIFVENRNSCSNHYRLPQLTYFDQLKSLKVISGGRVRFSGQFSLPLTLKKLSLLDFHLQWNDISVFHKLSSLKVLKLRSGAVDGKLWEMGDDDVFPKLKFLKLESLKIKQWIVSADNFPRLQTLVFERCKELEEIPCCIGEINCLEKVEVLWCSRPAGISAMQIQEKQKGWGNESLNVHIYPPVLDL